MYNRASFLPPLVEGAIALLFFQNYCYVTINGIPTTDLNNGRTKGTISNIYNQTSMY